MNKSATISKLAGALAKAQAEMPAVKFDGVNPFLKNKYATLGAVIETARPILAKHELSLMQSPVNEGDKIGVTTILIHSSGEFIEDTIYLPASDNKGLSVAQSAGIVISYLRRYSLQAFLNMYADEDTDGHKPEATQAKKQEKDHIVTDKLWEHFSTVANKAVRLGVPNVRVVERSKTTRDELTAYGVELAEAIKQIEAQNKAGG